MADAPSMASAMLSTISVASSFVAALVSSAYKIERTSRETKKFCDELDKLGECLRVLSDSMQLSQTPPEALWPGQQGCRTLLRGTSSVAACLPSTIQEMTGDYESVAFARCLEPLEAHCRQQAKYTPIFWRLQSWITVSYVLHDLGTITDTVLRKSS